MTGDQNGDDSKRAEETNPYQAPRTDLASAETEASIGHQNSDQRPNPVSAAILIGLVAGVLSGFAYMSAITTSYLLGPIAIILLIWISSYAIFGVVTTERPSQRISRAIQFGLLSIPLYLLFVPVCAIGSVAAVAATESLGAVGEGFAFIAGSTIAFVVVMTGLALVVRKSTHSDMQIESNGK